MDGKRISESSVITVQRMQPQDANAAGNVHGGAIMKLIDEAGGIVAHRHARQNSVTASVDRIDFLHPVFIGDVVTVVASLNLVGRTSMEVGVRVESENLLTGETRHTASAFLTYVALDDSGRPAEVPPIVVETEEEKRRYMEAQIRRKIRLQNKTNDE